MKPHLTWFALSSTLLCVLIIVAPSQATPIPKGYQPKAGDVVFQSFPPNPLTVAIEGCTKSPLSHCGLVAEKRTKAGSSKQTQWVVIEAVGPVQETPLAQWIARGRNQHLAVYQFKGDLAARVPEILAAARRYSGRPYDARFRWDDEKIYCSELVHKAIRDATGQRLGKMEKLGSLDWKPHEATIRTLEGAAPPLDREMVTPVSLARDPKLTQVFLSGYTITAGEVTDP